MATISNQTTYLNPGKEDGPGYDVVELHRPVTEKLKVSKLIRFSQQFGQLVTHLSNINILSHIQLRAAARNMYAVGKPQSPSFYVMLV